MAKTSRLVIVPLVLAGPALAQAPSLPTQASSAEPLSHIVIPIRVSINDIQAALEAQLPRGDAGARPGGIGGAVRNDTISWAFERGPLAIRGENNTLTAQTTIGGFARVAGDVQIIRGDLGRLLGNLNPTRIPFSAHADLRATVTATTEPKLVANEWRLEPNFRLEAVLHEATIPILDVAQISVRSKLQPELNEKVAQLAHGLNQKVRNDPFLENAARRAWSDLCRVWPLKIQRDGADEQLFLRSEPAAMSLGRLAIDAAALQAEIGVTAKLAVEERFSAPNCRDFPDKPAELQGPGVKLNVPVEISWGRLSNLLTDEFRKNPMPLVANAVTATIERIDVSDGGEGRIRADVRINARTGGFLGWFSAGGTGSLRISAKPVLQEKQLRFTDVQFHEVGVGTWGRLSPEVLNLLGAPLVQAFGDRLSIPVSQHEETARQRANQAMAALRERKIGGDALEVEQAEVTNVMLAGVSVYPNALQIEVAAHGNIGVRVRQIPIGR